MASGSERGFHGSPIVGYVRSPKLNDPELDKIESQIWEYAQARGCNLVEVVRDEGVSGVTTWKPGLERVIRGVERGDFIGVVIVSTQHLGWGQSAIQRNIDRLSGAGWLECLQS